MQMRFLGAAGFVAGSRTLLDWQDGDGHAHRALVDCGMFQGFKALRQRNWEPLEVPPTTVEHVLLTHAHIDHSGWIPALVKQGFRGKVYCSAGTADLLSIMLPDSGRIQQEDAERANRRRYSKHDPALPMYTEDDAYRALSRVEIVDWEQELELDGLQVSFHRAGHILGAASIRVDDGDTSILFSGDLGRSGDLLMPAPTPPPASEHVVLESTYGNRLHKDVDLMGALEDVVGRTVRRGGMVLIPAFAVGRSQAVLWALHELQESGRIPDVPIYLDSPMAVNTSGMYRKHVDELRLDETQVSRLFKDVRFIRTRQESKALNTTPGPMVLVSASGMLTGGRVLHHLIHRAGEPENTILFVGYQAPGTRGGRMLDGANSVKVYGQEVHIRSEVAVIDGLSAHADQDGLMAWLSALPEPPRRVWLNHGEPDSADTLRQRITEDLGWAVEAAREGVVYPLPAGAHPMPAPPKPAQGLDRGTVLVLGDLDEHPEAPRLLRMAAEAGGPVLRVPGPTWDAEELADARALIAFPGGFDTLAALFDALRRLEAGQIPSLPVVLIGREFWDSDFWKRAVPHRLVEGDDDGNGAPVVVDSAEAALDAVRDGNGGHRSGRAGDHITDA